jgi:hypothetical protein
MLEANNPDIDVDALMARVQHEVLRRQLGEPGPTVHAAASFDTSAVESLLAAASAHGGPRTSWPSKLRFVPGPLQRFGLRAIGWLFRDQLAFNASALQALRESVALTARLHAAVRELEARVSRLEDRG